MHMRKPRNKINISFTLVNRHLKISVIQTLLVVGMNKSDKQNKNIHKHTVCGARGSVCMKKKEILTKVQNAGNAILPNLKCGNRGRNCTHTAVNTHLGCHSYKT